MDFTFNQDATDVSKTEMEQVEKEKQEYKLLDSFLRTPGLKLFAYNERDHKIFEIEVSNKQIVDFNNIDQTCPEEATVDSRNIHFEALNIKTATKRVNKYLDGKIAELCNLKKPNPEGINFFK
jgi:hypothetical protein